MLCGAARPPPSPHLNRPRHKFRGPVPSKSEREKETERHGQPREPRRPTRPKGNKSQERAAAAATGRAQRISDDEAASPLVASSQADPPGSGSGGRGHVHHGGHRGGKARSQPQGGAGAAGGRRPCDGRIRVPYQRAHRGSHPRPDGGGDGRRGRGGRRGAGCPGRGRLPPRVCFRARGPAHPPPLRGSRPRRYRCCGYRCCGYR